MKQQIEELKKLRNKSYEIECLLWDFFGTKDCLEFEDKTDCLYKRIKGGGVVYLIDGEECDNGAGDFEVIEKDEYLVILNDYQQGVEDTYLIFLKSNEREVI